MTIDQLIEHFYAQLGDAFPQLLVQYHSGEDGGEFIFSAVIGGKKHRISIMETFIDEYILQQRLAELTETIRISFRRQAAEE